MTKKRLLYILYDSPNYPSGPIINYLRLLPALVDHGYDVHVLALYFSDYPNARILRERGVNIHVTPYFADSRNAVKWILDQAEKIQPDVFIPDVSTPGCLAGKWIKASGIPVVNSHRSDDDLNWGKAIFFSAPQYGYTSSAIFCVSKYLLNQLRQKVQNPDLITAVIPSGVPTLQNYSQQSDPVSIVYAGRLIQKQKRIMETVSIFIELAAKFKDITFTFVGDGPDRKTCEEMTGRFVFRDRFIFTGILKDDAYKKELAKHDIVILLSDYEGVPGSLMDSMASGLVPVCFHYPGAEELIIERQTGLLVKDRKDSVIEAVSMLMTDSELRKRLSRNARQHIVEHFSLEGALNKWELLINSLIEQNKDQKTLFTAPKTIELPPMNDLLKEHFIENKPPLLQHMLSKLRLRTRVRSFLKMFFKGTSNKVFDNFTTVPFSVLNLDLYLIRTSIKKALDWALPVLKGRLLDAGCGKMPYKDYILKNSAVSEYVGLDIETALAYDEKIQPDYTWDGKTMPFENNSFDCCIATEVLEHCPEPETFLSEVYRILKSGGVIFFTAPFLWNLHEVPNDEYRFTPFSLERHLNNSGFTEVKINATGGWHASMAQMLGLWVRRSPVSKSNRLLLSILIKPIMKYLINKDKGYNNTFVEGQMITGLYGLAKKR